MAGPTTGGGWSILGILKALGLVAAAGATGYMFSGSGDGIRLGDTDNSNKISIKPISNESSDRTVYMPTLGGDKYLVISSTDGGTPAGLGTMSTQNANAVAITGGTVTGITDLAVADGGTGSSTAAAARTALAVAGTGTTNTFTADQTMTGGANALTVGTPTTADATADTILAASATTQTPLVIQGKASQSASVFEYQKSDGSVTLSFTDAGGINSSNAIAATAGFQIGNSNNTLLQLNTGDTAHRFANNDTSNALRHQRSSTSESVNIQAYHELITINAAASTSGTSGALPADAFILGVVYRVTVQPPGTATFDIGVSGTTTKFGTGASTAAGTSGTSFGHTGGILAPHTQDSAAAILITPNATPSDNTGRIRVTTFYISLTAPSS